MYKKYVLGKGDAIENRFRPQIIAIPFVNAKQRDLIQFQAHLITLIRKRAHMLSDIMKKMDR